MTKKVTKKKANSKWVAKKHGFKSGLEENISQQIEGKGIKVDKEMTVSEVYNVEEVYSEEVKVANKIGFSSR